MKWVLCLAIVAVATALPVRLDDANTDCPTLLKQAQQQILDADAALKAATDNMVAVQKELDDAVNTAAAQLQAASTTYNNAVNKENYDIGTLNNDQAHLQDAINSLANIQAICTGPNPPADCADQIKKAQDTIAQWKATVQKDQSTINDDQAYVAYDQVKLDTAQKNYDIAIANRTTVHAELQKAVDSATKARADAQTNYEQIQKQCAANGESLFETVVPANDCQQDILNAQKQIADADAQLAKALNDYNTIMNALNVAVDSAAATEAGAQKTLNDATNKMNYDYGIMNNDKAHLQDSKNNLTNIEADCSGPAPPTNCQQLEAECKQTITQWEQKIASDQESVNEDSMWVNYDQQLFDKASKQYNDAIQNRTVWTQKLNDEVAAANQAKADAQTNYEAVQKRCSSNAAPLKLTVGASCDDLLKQAQQNVQAAADNLAATVDHANTVQAQLDKAVDTAAANEATAQKTLNDAVNKDNYDHGVLSNDQAHLQDAKNNLAIVTATCSAPNPPADCATQIKAAQDAIAKYEAQVKLDEQQVADDDAWVAFDKVKFDSAANAYQTAVQNRTVVHEELQAEVQKATTAYSDAETAYETIQKQCAQVSINKIRA